MPFWESSLFWGIVGLVGGLAVAVFFFILGKSRRVLGYDITSTPLVTEKMTDIPGLSVTLDGRPVQNLTSTTVKFTNEGNQTITLSDFAAREPLSISFSGGLLNTWYGHFVSSQNPNSTPTLEIIDDTTMNVEFDFLKPKQAFAVTLLHDGEFSVAGELKSGAVRKSGRYANRLLKKFEVFIGFGLGVAFLAAYIALLDIFSNLNNPDLSFWLSCMILAIALPLFILLLKDFVIKD